MKTITVPISLVREILADVENILTNDTKQIYATREFTLSSLAKLATLAGYATPSPEFNDWLGANRKMLQTLQQNMPDAPRDLVQFAVELHVSEAAVNPPKRGAIKGHLQFCKQ